MGKGWKNGGRTYAVGQAEADAELASRLAAVRERDDADRDWLATLAYVRDQRMGGYPAQRVAMMAADERTPWHRCENEPGRATYCRVCGEPIDWHNI